MPHSKTPGGQAASDKFNKQQAQSMSHTTIPRNPQYPYTLNNISQSQPNSDILSLSAHGLGADNAPGHTAGSAPGEKPVASDSGATNTGIEPGTNQPGEEGIKGVPVSSEPSSGNANMK
ncbi:MAG: hypothetical protein Q9166_002634 [cf. Caloplaca sp. 2 TL-2023]